MINGEIHGPEAVQRRIEHERALLEEFTTHASRSADQLNFELFADLESALKALVSGRTHAHHLRDGIQLPTIWLTRRDSKR